jgi:hypothetical protein
MMRPSAAFLRLIALTILAQCLVASSTHAEWSLNSPTWYGETVKVPAESPSAANSGGGNVAPEPGTFLLFVAGLAGLAARNFRIRARQPVRVPATRSSRR